MTTHAMARKLNAQMNLEFSASHLYVTLSNWCLERNLPRIAVYMRRQAQNCITHTMRVFDHMKKTGSHPIIKSVNIPPITIHSVDELLEQALDNQLLRHYELECLAQEAREETDNSTLSLLSDIYAEQQTTHKELMMQMDEYTTHAVSTTC